MESASVGFANGLSLGLGLDIDMDDGMEGVLLGIGRMIESMFCLHLHV